MIEQSINNKQNYKLAVRWKWLTNYYDTFVAVLMREKDFRTALLNQFQNKNPQKILDIGCGTGTLAIMLKQKFSQAVVAGLDGDANILEIAKTKAQKAEVKLDLRRGFSTDLPFENESFNVVTNTIMLHHLSDEDKIVTLKEAHRVLKSGGEINVADWGSPSNYLTGFGYYFIQLLDGFDTTTSNRKGLILQFLRETGFTSATENTRVDTILGTICLYQGIKS